MEQVSHEYNLVKTYESENAIIRVLKPVLTKDESERREKKLHKSTINLINELRRKENANGKF